MNKKEQLKLMLEKLDYQPNKYVSTDIEELSQSFMVMRLFLEYVSSTSSLNIDLREFIREQINTEIEECDDDDDDEG